MQFPKSCNKYTSNALTDSSLFSGIYAGSLSKSFGHEFAVTLGVTW